MRWIYLSPHFDDAVLSCGGLIVEQVRQGKPVEIWTICAGDAPPGPLSQQAQTCHAEWHTHSAVETLALRRAEDREAARLLGAGLRFFDIPDCIYRVSPAGEFLYPHGLNLPVHPEEAGLITHLADLLAEQLSPRDVLVCPMTVGSHVDHTLVRSAAVSLDRPLHYYADIPYAVDHPDALARTRRGMRSQTYPISEAALRLWQAGIAAYASQVPVLFGGDSGMRAAVRRYWGSLRGIRLWISPRRSSLRL